MSGAAEVLDYRGNPLSVGARVQAWRDGQRYTATVKEIKPQQASCGDHLHITLAREDDHAEVQSFSDAVVVIKEPGTETSKEH